MSSQIRPLSGSEKHQARRLAWEAFGFPAPAGHGPAADADDLYAGSGPTAQDWPGPGFHTVAAFDDGELQGQVMAREFHTWVQDQRVPTCGVAGVTIAAEHRGAGLITPLLRRLLTQARQRGDAIATLYATAPGIYQRFGFETVSAAHTVTVPTTAAAAVRRGAPVRLRRAREADVPALRTCYLRWAAARTGALDRVAPSFQRTAAQVVARYDAITMALAQDGSCLGYACWNRGGIGSDVLKVQEFIATDEAAYRALWRMFGSFSSVAARIELRTCAADAARTFLPTNHWDVADGEPYMLRLLDVPAALGMRKAARAGEVRFSVTGDECGLIEGTYRVRGADGTISCAPGEGTGREMVLTAGGLSGWYAGVLSVPDLVDTGRLTGGTPQDREALGALLVHQPWQIHDEF